MLVAQRFTSSMEMPTRCGSTEFCREQCELYQNFTQHEKDTHRNTIHGRCPLKTLEQEPILDKIIAEIEQKIEQERFARSVFRGEEKDYVKAEQCTGSIMAYYNVIKLIDKYKAENEESKE